MLIVVVEFTHQSVYHETQGKFCTFYIQISKNTDIVIVFQDKKTYATLLNTLFGRNRYFNTIHLITLGRRK